MMPTAFPNGSPMETDQAPGVVGTSSALVDDDGSDATTKGLPNSTAAGRCPIDPAPMWLGLPYEQEAR